MNQDLSQQKSGLACLKKNMILKSVSMLALGGMLMANQKCEKAPA
jgi:hypothetical protein